MEDLAWLRDEVNEPLGLLPGPDQRPAAGATWKMLPLVAPALVAVAMAAFTLGRHDAASHAGSLAARTETPGPAHSEPTPSQEPVVVDKPVPPPIATADQVEAASGVKVARPGGAAAPIPLIIDVQQTLAAAKKAARDAQR